MDQRRFLLFIAISIAIITAFQVLFPAPAPSQHPAARTPVSMAPVMGGPAAGPTAPSGVPVEGTPAAQADTPRLAIDAPRMAGSIALAGARLDDLQLRDYHETVSRQSPLVRVLAPPGEAHPNYLEFGWSGSGTKLPDNRTTWIAQGNKLSPGHPVSLTWDNGAGASFGIEIGVDENYLFTVRQSVRNTGDKPLDVTPWQSVHREFTPKAAGYNLFEGLIGVVDARTKQFGYSAAKNQAEKDGGIAFQQEVTGGWSGFTDDYWLTAIVPDQGRSVRASWNYTQVASDDHYQMSYVASAPEHVVPGAEASTTSRAFVGAKEVHLLDRYEARQGIPLLSYAVDWGWFFFLTKPFFYAIDWLNSLTGNFGIAILIFTVFVKLAFYPLAATAYRSMGKMRLLAPKIQAARERFKDDPARQQSAMMEVYKQEGISPMAQAGGCLPLVIQIPVFFSLYKVILVTIEMRHAPFFGWIRDLSATDPTNVFNLFGLLPFDPAAISPTLHLGIWPLILGLTMFFQQRLNPPPPDPMQARIFQFMPIIFTFMMGRFPAGLVIYWSWNNTLTIVQQWWIQRNAKLSGPQGRQGAARA